ncbi:MAG TPA: NADH-quinone oxidoreductase subunit M [Methylomirabilota bacterium]|jgi:NADH-quinone oxidoreductase subunit M|nr:NADH-quinone oxidoreductase subunit M [Methylomirabilota bacterium]
MLLTAIVFLPTLGALTLLLLDRRDEDRLRGVALWVSIAAFLVSVHLWILFERGRSGMQFVERYAWIPVSGITYHLGVDGISLLLVLLTTFLMPLCLLSAWSQITTRVKEFLIAMLLLETAMLGVFVALDLFLFFVFWEAMLIPMYLVIGVWGGPRRIYAAVKFILYTMLGSALMLLAILVLYYLQGRQTGVYTFDYPTIARMTLEPGIQVPLFLAFALAFAIKVPMFPFHTWLPDAHVEAPTAGSVILAGVLLKMGTYGFVRFCLPLFPHASAVFAPAIFVLAVIGILYGAWVSMVQPDLKKLIAYSSVSHLGFVMLGLFALNAQGVQGGILQMVNHGLSTGALFLLVGMIYERRHSRLIADFGGLWAVVPLFSAVFLFVTLSSIGLPGLNGFVGEFLILVGAFQVSRLFAVLGTLGIIFAAVYMLWMYQRVAFGPVRHEESRHLPDLGAREIATLAPILLLILWVGVYPKPFTAVMEASVAELIAVVKAKAGLPIGAWWLP